MEENLTDGQNKLTETKKAEEVKESSETTVQAEKNETISEASKTNAKKSSPKRNHFKFFFINFFVFIIILSGIATALYFVRKKLTVIRTEKTKASVSSQIEKVCELTVLKNNYSDIIAIKKSAAGGLAKAYSIIKYNGVIRAGIKDASLIKLEFSDDGKSIKATIPHSQILGNGIVKQEVFDEKTSIFVPITTNEIFNEIQKAMNESQTNFIRSGLLTEADLHAKQTVRSFLAAFGYEFIEVTF